MKPRYATNLETKHCTWHSLSWSVCINDHKDIEYSYRFILQLNSNHISLNYMYSSSSYFYKAQKSFTTGDPLKLKPQHKTMCCLFKVQSPEAANSKHMKKTLLQENKRKGFQNKPHTYTHWANLLFTRQCKQYKKRIASAPNNKSRS